MGISNALIRLLMPGSFYLSIMTPKAKDVLWKGIIEDLFADFLRFFYTGADELFDMDKGFEFLDKELGQLYPGKDIKDPKFVDKLVKVYKKDGTEEWLLIHLEVQGYHDKLFARRMFTYFYRILDRFDKEVASIAVFSDNDKNYQPDRYVYSSLDTSNIFRFKTYKIKGQDMAALENSDNPFAIVILTVLIALQKQEIKQDELLNLSVELAKRLFRKGFSRVKVNHLLDFIKAYVFLDNQEICLKFEEEIDIITAKNKTMGIRELATQLIEERGIEKGEMKAKTATVTNMLLRSNLSLSEIADFASVSVDFVIEVKNGLSPLANN
jgi:hypothetical protein